MVSSCRVRYSLCFSNHCCGLSLNLQPCFSCRYQNCVSTLFPLRPPCDIITYSHLTIIFLSKHCTGTYSHYPALVISQCFWQCCLPDCHLCFTFLALKCNSQFAALRYLNVLDLPSKSHSRAAIFLLFTILCHPHILISYDSHLCNH